MEERPELNSREEKIEYMEERGGDYGLVPDPVEFRAYQLLQSNENIDYEVLDYALEQASEYWREHIEEKGNIVGGGEKMELRFQRRLDEGHKVSLFKDLKDEYREKLEAEEISELAENLAKLPEDDPLENVPWDCDPKWSEEDEDYPSMFQ